MQSVFKFLQSATGSASAGHEQAFADQSSASRRHFLRRSGMLALGGASAGLLMTGSARATEDTTASVDLSPATYFPQIQAHENAHLAFLQATLGSNARPAPTFHNIVMDTVDDFIATAQMIENLETAAYLATAPYIMSSTYLAAAGSILDIEARHASYLNALQSDPLTGHVFNFPDNESFESTVTLDQLRTTVAPFVRSLNGGPPLTFTAKKSAANDINILNTALASEYLGVAFYGANVSRFFG